MLALRLIIRRAVRRPATSAATVCLAAVSLAVTTAFFSLVDAVFLKPLPVSEPDRLVLLKMRRPHQADTPLSIADIERFRQSPAFQGVEAMGFAAEEGGDLEEGVRYVTVTAGFFHLLGVKPVLGPGFVAGLDDERCVVLGYDLWRRHFGADSRIVGRAVRLLGGTVTVAGVMPAGFSFPYGVNLWKLPLPAYSKASFAFLAGVARLAPVPLDVAGSMVPSASVRPLSQEMRPHGAFTLVFLFVATVLTALVTWGQVALLQLAAAVEQTAEYAVRLALGASRKRLALDSLLEGLLLALASVAVGWWLVPAVIAAVVRVLPPELLQGRVATADARAFLFGLAASVAGVLVCSGVSSHLAASPPLPDALRARTVVGRSRSATTYRSVLVVTQVAVTASLLYVTAISVKSLGRLSSVELGFETEGYVSVRLPWTAELIRNREAGLARFHSTVALLKEATGASGAAGTDTAPLTRGSVVVPASRSPYLGAVKTNARVCVVTPGYFSLLKTHLLAGRDFADADRAGSPLVAVVNRPLLNALEIPMPGTGHDIYVMAQELRIVGVVQDTFLDGPERGAGPQVYLAASQQRAPIQILLAIHGDPGTVRQKIHDAIGEAWGRGGKPNVYDLAAEYRRVTAGHRGRSSLLLALAVSALVLSAVGFFGAMVHSLRQRMRDVAIHLCLGAPPVALVSRLIASSFGFTALGLSIGLAAGLGIAQWSSSTYFGVKAVDGTAIGVVTCVFAVLTALSCVRPAWRAISVNPAAVLRSE